MESRLIINADPNLGTNCTGYQLQYKETVRSTTHHIGEKPSRENTHLNSTLNWQLQLGIEKSHWTGEILRSKKNNAHDTTSMLLPNRSNNSFNKLN